MPTSPENTCSRDGIPESPVKPYERSMTTFSSGRTAETESSEVTDSEDDINGDEMCRSEDCSDDDYDSSDFSDSDCSSEKDCTMSGSSDDWSSSDDEYDELMASLPVAFGGKGGPPQTRFIPPAPETHHQQQSRAGQPLAGPPLAGPTEIPCTPLSCAGDRGISELTDPIQGLEMFKNLRSELEQVGRMIVANKDGEKFLQRAHVLASINWLATNVPSCVLDHLGKEIRRTLQSKSDKEESKSEDFFSSGVVVGDESSESTEISELDELMSDESTSLNDGDDDFLPRPDFAVAFRPPRMEKASSTLPKPATSLKTFLTKDSAPIQGKGPIRMPGIGSPGSFVQQFRSPRSTIRKMSDVSTPGSIVQQCLSPRSTIRKLSVISTPCSIGSGTSTNTTATSTSGNNLAEKNLPSVSHFECALLFVDISGFTNLATRLDPENLSKVINSYFQKIVDNVFEFSGDVQKFAGDALFAEWRVSPRMSLALCVEAAAACASKLVKDCADFPVMAVAADAAHKGSLITHLNIHCGLSVGEMAGIHVGDSKRRREYVYVGNPIRTAAEACDLASLGQVVATRKVYNILSWSGVIDEPFVMCDKKDYFTIAGKDSTKLQAGKLMGSYNSGVRNGRSRGVTEHVDGLELDALKEYRRLMSLYVHPVVVSNDVAASDNFKSSRATSATQESHREEAELRNVYVMFINPKIDIDLSGADYLVAANALNDIMTVVTRELTRYNGHLRQFIVDDKGLVMIATFGLRGSTFPNLVAERALPATVIIHNALQMELGIDTRIGASFGDVYCGPVGGMKRHEYAVMGPSVNLAARLMASTENPGILVDNAVRNQASKSYSFNALAMVIAKGYKDPVPIFEPLAALDRTWGLLRDEITKLVHIAREMTQNGQSAPTLALLSAPSGMGKSTALVHSIEHIRKMMGHTASLLVAKNVGNENDTHVPFKTIRPILLKALQHFTGVEDEDESDIPKPFSEMMNASFLTITSTFSEASSSFTSTTKTAECLYTIGKRLNAKPTLVDLVRRTVLEDAGAGKLPRSWESGSNALGDMVRLISKVLRVCSQDTALTVIALDDIHHTDAASWLVFRELFETADKLLLVGTTSSSSDFTFRMEPEFWCDLNDVYAKSNRFVRMELPPLSNEDQELMAVKVLGVQREDISPEILNEVLVQSGGMPHFASKVLQGIKARLAASDNVGSFDVVTDSVSEIILHRIDTFDLSLRNTLNVGAVLGESFTFADVLAVLKDGSEAKEEDVRRQTVESLKLSVREGILLARSHDGLKIDGETFSVADDTAFTFYHNVWPATLLSLMLGSRKCDLHRKIALSMDRSLGNEGVSSDFKLKLFKHWKATGDTAKAASLALLTGKGLEEEPANVHQSFSLYKECLMMWGWDIDADAGQIAGFSSHVLSILEPEDVCRILRLMVAYGRALALAGQHRESVQLFETGLRMFQVADSSSKLTNRSVIFPAFVGISQAIANGHINQDAKCRYEQVLLRRFLEDTRIHGRLIHHIYALYLQMNYYSRKDELENAIACQSIIKKLYKPEKHSRLLNEVYGMDVGALSYSLAAFYEMVKGDTKKALRSCRHILKDILSKVERDYEQSFSIMYPLALILKEAGHTSEARAFFDKVVVESFVGDQSTEKGPFPLPGIYKALTILFDLSGKRKVRQDKIKEYVAWSATRGNVVFDDRVNIALGRLGRCANTICAEICLLLSTEVSDDYDRAVVLETAKQLARRASIFHRRNGAKVALRQAELISTRICLVGG